MTQKTTEISTPKRFTKLTKAKENVQKDIDTKIKAGVHVMHQKFGRGKIESIEGEGADQKAEIHFEKAEFGVKHLLLQFAKLRVLKIKQRKY